MKNVSFISKICIFTLLTSCAFLSGCNSNSHATKTHTVIFDTGCDIYVESRQVVHGEKITKPENIERDGYTLIGWTYEGEPWSFVGYVVTSDMTLVADWSLNVYNITYELDGRDNNPLNPSTYTIEDEVVLYDPSGEDFHGWALNGELITTIDKGTFGDLVLVAERCEYYYVYTSYNNSLGTVSGKGRHEYNTLVTLTAIPTADNEFGGWYDDENTLITKDLTYSFMMPKHNILFNVKFVDTPYEDEGIDKIVFSDYDESSWFSMGGSKHEEEINNTELTIRYDKDDMCTGSMINDGWCLANLSLKRNFVDGNALKVKIKCSHEQEITEEKAVINIVEKNGTAWRFHTPYSSLSEEYTELTIPFTDFFTYTDSSTVYATKPFKSIYFMSFGVEYEFGTGTVSFKDLQIVNC